ncbi:putative triacylglycerol lipase [Yarrowia sp. B02]|nr:putative triacylglycerol lipase [Yarrowia sp. B02]
MIMQQDLYRLFNLTLATMKSRVVAPILAPILAPFVALLKNLWVFFTALLELLFDVSWHWMLQSWHWWCSTDQKTLLQLQLDQAETYEEWESIASELDELLGNDVWRQTAASKRYDYRLIAGRLRDFIECRAVGDIATLISRLRSGLLRNLGSISSLQLYTRSYLGSKLLIEEYITEVIDCLKYIKDYGTTAGLDTKGVHFFPKSEQRQLDSEQLTRQKKHKLFYDTRQSFGRTALVLQGGTIFGLTHLGTIKALTLQGLLPGIITGFKEGAFIAALTGIYVSDLELLETIDSLPDTLNDLYQKYKERLAEENKHKDHSFSNSNSDYDFDYAFDFEQFANTYNVTFSSVTDKVLRSEYPPEIKMYEEFIETQLGDLTFEEAFNKSDRVLNIVAHSHDSSFPTLMNYLTTPNVLIRSACRASMVTAHDEPQTKKACAHLLVKDDDHRVISYDSCKSRRGSSTDVILGPVQEEVDPLETGNSSSGLPKLDITTDGWKRNDEHTEGHVDTLPGHVSALPTPSYSMINQGKIVSPYARLSELFNVNHFIVSLSRPYLAPLLAIEGRHRGYHGWRVNLIRVLKLEFEHRLAQFDYIGLLPTIFRRFFIDDKIPGIGPNAEVLIVPELAAGMISDFKKAFSNHDIPEKVRYWTTVGERATWPLVAAIWARTAIEYTLNDMYNQTKRQN